MRSRSLGIVVLILLIALGTSPYICGYLFKQNYLQLIDSLNQESTMQIKVDSYEQGWLSSNVKLTISPNSISLTATGPQVKTDFTVEQNIQHGPLVKSDNHWIPARANIHSVVHSPAFVKLMLDAVSFASSINVDTLVTTHGDYQTQYILPPSNSTALGQKGKLSWDGLIGNIDLHVVNNQIQNINAKSIIGNLVYSDDETKITSQPITLENVLSRDTSNLFVGSFSVKYPGFNITAANMISASLSNLNMNTSNIIHDKDFIDSTVNIAVNNITTPEIVINPSTITISLLNLKTQGFINFKRQIQDTSKLLMNTEPNLTMFTPIFLSLISPTTTINADINLATSHGRLLSNGQVSFSKNVSMAKSMDDLTMDAKAKVTIRISSILAKEIMNSVNSNQNETSHTDTNTQPIDSASAPEAPKQKLIVNINQMASAGLITSSTSFQIIHLIESNSSLDDFNRNLDTFATSHDISADLATQLKQEYANMQQAVLTVKDTGSSSPKASPHTNEDTLQGLVSQGFITQENDEYVTLVTFENGVLYMNGKDVSSNPQ